MPNPLYRESSNGDLMLGRATLSGGDITCGACLYHKTTDVRSKRLKPHVERCALFKVEALFDLTWNQTTYSNSDVEPSKLIKIVYIIHPMNAYYLSFYYITLR